MLIYCPISDLHDISLSKGDIVINLHNWNRAPISEDAQEYASQIGVQLFSQNAFFAYAHKHIK